MANGKPGPPLGSRNAAKNKPITEAIIKSLHDECEHNGVKTKRLFVLAAKLVDRAVEDGDMQAVKEVLDRVEGKAQQILTVEGSPFDDIDTATLAAAIRFLETLSAEEASAVGGDEAGSVH